MVSKHEMDSDRVSETPSSAYPLHDHVSECCSMQGDEYVRLDISCCQ